jgi:K+/H+ antiporter YhaU regulatory subunit KhtT
LSNYKTNPCAAIVEDEKCVPPVVNTAAVLWTIDGEKKTLAYYLGDSDVTDDNYSGTNGSILSYFMQDTISNNDSDMVGYFFINFTNQEMANEYFKDYFTAKPDAIKQYLDLYLEMTGSNSTVTVTKGNTYEKISDSWQNILGNSVFPDTQADYLASRYASLSESPMELYVDTEKLDQSLGEKQFKSGNTVVAIVAKGNCTFSGGTAKVIIASGNVTVNADFTGIIIAGGTVYLNSHKVTFDKPTEEILASVCETTTERLSDYLNAGMFSDEGTEKVNEWSPDKLVYYNNWQKN